MAAQAKQRLSEVRKILRDSGCAEALAAIDSSSSKDANMKAAMELARAEALLASDEHDDALVAAQSARALAASARSVEWEVDAIYRVTVPAHCSKGNAAKANEQALEALKIAGSAAVPKARALIAMLQSSTAPGATTPQQIVTDVVKKAQETSQSIKDDAVAKGLLATCLARASLLRSYDSQAVREAKLAESLLRQTDDFEAEVEAAEILAWASPVPEDSVATADEKLKLCLEKSEGGLAARMMAMLLKAHQRSDSVIILPALVEQAVSRLDSMKAPLAAAKAKLYGAQANIILKANPDIIWEQCEDASERFKKLQDRRGQADVNLLKAKVQVMCDSHEAAMMHARQAALLYRQCYDRAGEEEVKVFMSEICSATGVVALAPDRTEVEKVLNDLKTAVGRKSATDFEAALVKLDTLRGWVESDLDKAVRPALESDRPGTQAFLKKYGLNLACTKDVAEAGWNATHQDIYLGFAVGGLGYGTRFRNNTTPVARMHKGQHIQQISVCGIGVMGEMDHEDWETHHLFFHPGIHDSALHTGATIGQAEQARALGLATAT
mmetsp:Transcript_7882/g.17375  ORF Transcript_7882/g.17375 Transcript_7882/m.17375 type:complete len:555 (-) Transcript_7882:141-1805(-)